MNLNEYTPVLDLACDVFAFIFMLVLRNNYVKYSRNLLVFKASIGLICFCSSLKVTCYTISKYMNEPVAFRVLSTLYILGLILLMQLYVSYVSRLMIYKRTFFMGLSGIVNLVGMLLAFVDPYSQLALNMTYIVNAGIMIICCFKNSRHIPRQIQTGLCAAGVISFILVVIEQFTVHSIFTVFTFLLPLLVVMIMVHVNPYDLGTGALNTDSFNAFLISRRSKLVNDKFIIVKLQDYTFTSLPEELKNTGRQLCARLGYTNIFNPLLDTLVLVVNKNRNTKNMVSLAKEFAVSKKIFVMEDVTFIEDIDCFKETMKQLGAKTSWEDIYVCTEEDVQRAEQRQKCTRYLQKLYNENNMDNPQVLAYCQPVKNVHTNTCDTGEILMRIKAEDGSMIYPDLFIPILEEYDMIHRFSMMILHKACLAVKELNMTRVTVNFSGEELKEASFMSDFKNIIEASGVPYSKIGIEFTESRNDADYDRLKDIISQMKALGCVIYLDDFGTGYSNFDRVFSLGADVIKFDKSLVDMASEDKQSGMFFINAFSDTFSKLGMKILYEGIETDKQEEICILSHADYLQGYKYSKPVPVQELFTTPKKQTL